MDFLRYGIFYPFSPYCLIKKLFTIYPDTPMGFFRK